MTHIVIIGNGISGVTAARHIRKNSDYKITLISAETDYFFSRTALMYVYMGHMKFEHTQPYEPWFWKKNRIDLLKGYVETIDFETKTLNFSQGDKLQYDKLIIATGSKPNKFGWKGQDLDGVGGLFSKRDLDHMEQFTKGISRGVIVGGGLAINFIAIPIINEMTTQKVNERFIFWFGIFLIFLITMFVMFGLPYVTVEIYNIINNLIKSIGLDYFF